jgi:nucleolar GTP-binding protein
VLESDEWRFDTIPEFLDGKNTMDFFDADIEDRYRTPAIAKRSL